MDSETIYNCKACNFVTNQQHLYNKHILCKKHIRNTNEEPEMKYCPECEYVTAREDNYRIHLLKHASEAEREKKFKFFCKECNFGSNTKKTMENHEKSNKHQRMMMMKHVSEKSDNSSDSESD